MAWATIIKVQPVVKYQTAKYADGIFTVNCPHCENDFHRWGHQQSFVENDFRGLAIDHGLEVVELFAIRYSRVKRFRFLGTGICGSRWFKNWMRRATGKRHLVLVAEKQASASPNVPMKPAA